MSVDKLLDSISNAEEVDGFPDLSKADIKENRIRYEIADAIKKQRKKLSFSQKDLAEILGVSQPMISSWESGEYNFTIETLARIADKLNMEFNVSLQEMPDASKGFENNKKSKISDNNIIIDFSEAA